MKKTMLILALLSAAVTANAQEAHRGYFRSNGTYVQPHYQTAPDGNKFNNYSTQGNVNPYTGQQGYENPYYTRPINYGREGY